MGPDFSARSGIPFRGPRGGPESQKDPNGKASRSQKDWITLFVLQCQPEQIPAFGSEAAVAGGSAAGAAAAPRRDRVLGGGSQRFRENRGILISDREISDGQPLVFVSGLYTRTAAHDLRCKRRSTCARDACACVRAPMVAWPPRGAGLASGTGEGNAQGGSQKGSQTRAGSQNVVGFKVGERVRCRDAGEKWQSGTVTDADGPKVRIDDSDLSFTWYEVQPA
eukprot:gene17108-biopygen12340